MFFTVIKVARITQPFHETRIRLVLCLAYRTFPALLMWLLPLRSVLNGEYGFASVLCDGLFMAVVTTDILVCRMAKRQLHPWVVMMGMVSLVSSATCLMFSAFYCFKLFQELCNYSNESLLSANINVYCDGVYDVCHEGHMVSIQSDAVVAVIIDRIVFISSFLFYCLLLNHSFQTNPNSITNCFKLLSLLQLTTTFAPASLF